MHKSTGQYNAKITAIGKYLPEKILDNKYFEDILETNDEWIISRTGIKERRMIENGATSDLAIGAVQDMLKNFNVNPEEIDLIIVATVTPDMFFPSTSCLVQGKCGMKNAWAFDLNGACSGFIYALTTGAQFIQNGSCKKVLVIGADKMTAISDYSDRNTCILFGDAAACTLLEPTEDKNDGLIDFRMYSDGSVAKNYLHMLGGGSLNPSSHETVDKKMHYIYQNGKAVFKAAVKGMADVSAEMMERNNLIADDVAYLIPHQANLRIIDATRERMGISKDKVMINIEKYGNTTAATIPLCLVEWFEDGKIKKGDNLILTSFGAGYTWGGIYLKWSI